MSSIKKPLKSVMGPKMVFGYLGIFMVLIGLLTALPLALLIFYPEEVACWREFAYPSLANVGIGLLLYFAFIFKRRRANFARNENNALLILIWVIAVISGAFPFYLAHLYGNMSMTFSESIFESASAYSTTGLTCFKDYVDGKLVLDSSTSYYHFEALASYCPHIYTFHRAEMQFVGGVGLVLLLSMVLGNSGGMSLYVGEGHGDRLLPNLRKSAARIFGIYIFYALLGVLALFLAGMEPFDAAVTSMGALSGGGFSPRSSNIAYYSGEGVGNGIYGANPIAIEIVTMVLVIFSAISFVLHTFLLSGKWKSFFKDDEIRFFFCLLVFGVSASFLGCLIYQTEVYSLPFSSNLGGNFRDVVFYVVGSASTSGFANTSLDRMMDLGHPLIFICTVLMLIGGGAGSPGGGIKQYRVFVVIKDLAYRVRYQNSPSRILHPKRSFHYGEEREIDDATVKEASQYCVLFLFVFAISVTVLCFLPGVDAESAAFDVASAMSNTGLSAIDFVAYGVQYPGYYEVMLWTLAVGSFLGRLEIFPLFYGVSSVGEEISYYAKLRKGLSQNNE